MSVRGKVEMEGLIESLSTFRQQLDLETSSASSSSNTSQSLSIITADNSLKQGLCDLITSQQELVGDNEEIEKELALRLTTCLTVSLSRLSYHANKPPHYDILLIEHVKLMLDSLALLIRPKEGDASSTNLELIDSLLTSSTGVLLVDCLLASLQDIPKWVQWMNDNNENQADWKMWWSCWKGLLTLLRNISNADKVVNHILSSTGLPVFAQVLYVFQEQDVEESWIAHEVLLLAVVFNLLSSNSFEEDESNVLLWRKVLLEASDDSSQQPQPLVKCLVNKLQSVSQMMLANGDQREVGANEDLTKKVKELNNTSNLMQALSPAPTSSTSTLSSTTSMQHMQLSIIANVLACSASKDSQIAKHCLQHEVVIFETLVLSLVSNIAHVDLITQLLTSVLLFLQPISTDTAVTQDESEEGEEAVEENASIAKVLAAHGLNETLVFLISHSQANIAIILKVCQCIQLLALDTTTTTIEGTNDVFVQNEHIQQLIAAKSCEILTITLARQLPKVIQLRSAIAKNDQDALQKHQADEDIMFGLLISIVKSFVIFAYYEELVIVRLASCGAIDIFLQLTEEVLQVYLLLVKLDTANNPDNDTIRNAIEQLLQHCITLFFFITSTSSMSTEQSEILHQLRESQLLVMLLHMMKHMMAHEEFMFHASALLVHLIASSSMLPSAKNKKQQHDFGFMTEQNLPGNNVLESEQNEEDKTSASKTPTAPSTPLVSFTYLNLMDFCEVMESTMTKYVQHEGMMENILSILRHVTTKALKTKPSEATTTTSTGASPSEEVAEGGYFDLNLRLGSFIIGEGLCRCYELYHDRNEMMMIHLCIIVGNFTAINPHVKSSASRLKAMKKMKDKFMTCQVVDVIGKLRQAEVIAKFQQENQSILKNVTYYAIVNLTRDHEAIRQLFAAKYNIQRNWLMNSLDWIQSHHFIFQAFIVIIAVLMGMMFVYAKK